uniref:Uncharacterized protein n=1 Tax=Globisporangium ultimum (strain ATCC 200006 / CBS 805.95 / DAOM BR144) TaxID=431595 RepID=K3WIK3_GLOUD
MQTSPVRAPPPHSYAVPVAAAPVDVEYGIPVAVASSSTDYRVSDHNSHSSSEDGRDVWGNAVDSYRGKRTESNVSVEF